MAEYKASKTAKTVEELRKTEEAALQAMGTCERFSGEWFQAKAVWEIARRARGNAEQKAREASESRPTQVEMAAAEWACSRQYDEE
jgi:hypothetical protein